MCVNYLFSLLFVNFIYYLSFFFNYITGTNASEAENLYSMSKFYHNIDDFGCPKAPNPTLKGSCHVQMLRSIGPWSLGLSKEQSLMTCWCDEISRSQHFIYIENQYFIGTPNIRGGIPNAILERLVLAYKRNEKFRVIIVLPQHPDGDFVESMNPRFVLSYQQKTIYKGSQSLIQSFKQMCPGVNPSDYIEFYCLRNWGILNDKFVSDQVYVHDKFLIVDDRVAIIGSANINDRSMNGDRDTEVGIRIEDTNIINTCMAGNYFKVGALPHNLRIKLMNQHIGISIPENDYLSDQLYDPLADGYKQNSLWNKTANSNTKIYDDLDMDFSVYKCRTLSQYKQSFVSHTNRLAKDPAVIYAMDNIKGFLVHWPMDFLADDDIAPSVAQKLVMPVELWT
jgi:phospholipase D1/2